MIELNPNELSKFPENSIDVVFTDAVLLYIGPDKIAKVIKEMLRVARRRIVVLEMHVNQDLTQKDLFTKDGWLRDYEALFRKSASHKRITVEKLPVGMRTSGRWSGYGHIIEIDLS